VAERVVDELEAVEVDEDDRGRGAIARPPSERVPDAVGEQRAVRQPRQPVVERLVAQPRLRRPQPLVPGEVGRGDRGLAAQVAQQRALVGRERRGARDRDDADGRGRLADHARDRVRARKLDHGRLAPRPQRAQLGLPQQVLEHCLRRSELYGEEGNLLGTGAPMESVKEDQCHAS
jgi:hypothetical protein